MEVQIENLPKSAVALKFTITQEDYKSNFQKKVNQYAKQAVMPGFRPGKVPPDLIKAQYGPSILMSIVNDQVSEELQKQINENNFELIAKPLLKKTDFKDLKPNQDFYFEFHLALFPEVQIDFSKLPPLPAFQVEVTENDIEEQVRYLQRNNSEHIKVQVIEDVSQLYHLHGDLYEIDENGVRVNRGFRTMLSVYSDAEKIQPYIKQGLSVHDKLNIPFDAYFDGDKDAALVLHTSIDEAKELRNKNFIFEIQEIKKVQLIDKETELFQKIFRNSQLTYEEGLKLFKEELQKDLLKMQHDYQLKTFEKQLVETHPIEINEEIVAYSIADENKISTIEELEEIDPDYITKVKTHILKTKIFKDFPELDVTVKDVAKRVEEDFKKIFQYGEDDHDHEHHHHDHDHEHHDHDHTETEDLIEELKPHEHDHTLEYIRSVSKQMMKDKNFVNKKMYEMENQNLLNFLHNRIGQNERSIPLKDFFETIHIH